MSETAHDAARELREQIVSNQKLIDRLNEDLSRKTDQVRIIQEVSREITSTLRIDEILAIILDSMDRTLGFKHAMILLLDDPAQTLRVVASRGYPQSGIGATVPVGVGTIGVVAKRKRMLRMSAVGSGLAYTSAVRAGMEAAGTDAGGTATAMPGLAGVQSQIAIPLLIKDQLVGVFAVESVEHAAFDELDEVLITILAHQAASAIHNAQLYDTEQRRIVELDEARTRLAALNGNLEALVKERTTALESANAEITQALASVQAEKQRSHDLLGRMAPPQVIPLLLEDTLLARKLNATILFTDLEGFTKFSSGMEPDELFAKLNHFFSRAGLSIEKYRGYVNKTNGDSIMALFGVPFEGATHALDAVLAALDMQAEIQSHFNLRMRIGVNSGPITAGILGPDNKSLYDVLGDAVNVASRMEKLCPAGAVTLSEATAKLVEPWFDLESLGKQQVKGKGAMQAFAVTGVRPFAADRRRVDPGSRFAQAHAGIAAEVEARKSGTFPMVDVRSIQARDGAVNHNEAVAAFALALLRELQAAAPDAVRGVEESDVLDLALLHDLGKHAIDPARLNDPALDLTGRERLRADLLRETIAVAAQLGRGGFESSLTQLYACEQAKSSASHASPLVWLVTAPDIYDALTAPKLYKGKGWTIMGSLEELLRLSHAPEAVPFVRAFADLMKPAGTQVAEASRATLKFK